MGEHAAGPCCGLVLLATLLATRATGSVLDDELQNRILFQSINVSWSCQDDCKSCGGTAFAHLGEDCCTVNFNRWGIGGKIPDVFDKLSCKHKVTELSLGGNKFTGTLPVSISALKNLRYLWLGGNNLTGTISPALGSLARLEGIALDGNHLIGSIPGSFGDLSNLSFMYLSGNHLTGRLPSELRKLRKLGTAPPHARRTEALNHASGDLHAIKQRGTTACMRADSLCVHGNDFAPKPTFGFVHGCCEDACPMALEVYTAQAGSDVHAPATHTPEGQTLGRTAWPYMSTAVASAVMLAAVVSFWKFASGSLPPRQRHAQLRQRRGLPE